MPEPHLLSAALLLGLLGAGHCIGMCGGLAAALGTSLDGSIHPARRAVLILLYNLGRISSYTAAGLLAGLLGAAALGVSLDLMLPLRVAGGLLLIAMGAYLAGWWQAITRLEGLGRHAWRRLQPLAARLLPANTIPRAFSAGVVWGWLPCGLVYSTLGWAATQGQPGQSAVLMLAFGIGTLPTLIAAGWLAEPLRAVLARRQVRMGSGLLVMAFGVWTLLPPLLHGNHAAHATHQASPIDTPAATTPAHEHHHH